MDKLIISGLGKRLDGEYEIGDFLDLVTIGTPASLTNREAHRVKVMTGVRAGELMAALASGDSDVTVALAAVILERHGKRVDEDLLWDAPVDSGITFDLAERDTDEEDDDESPPAEPAETPADESSTSGGGSSRLTLESPANDQSPTGLRGSEMSAVSGRATSAS